MRAKEFIKEDVPRAKTPKRLVRASHGSISMRDEGGYDRTYHLNRIWMAAAMADGKSTDPVDMDPASFVEKFNFAIPYTQEEHNMLVAAMKTIPTDCVENLPYSKSEESPTTNKVSPVAQWMKKS